MKSLKNFFKKTPTISEIPEDDLSVLKNNKFLYIETAEVKAETNEFRKDYRKVILTIKSIKNGNHLNACRNMFNAFKKKHSLYPNASMVMNTRNTSSKEQLVHVVCGHVEHILQEEETLYRVI